MIPERQVAMDILSTLGHPATVIELGAHHGNDTVDLYDASAKPCRYIAVEADPRNIPVLRQRIAPRPVTVVHAAVWSECGGIPYHLCEGNANGSSSARQPLKHLECFPEIPFRGVVQVPSLTLDVIAHGIAKVDLIWSDIQGAERDMVAGGKETLARTSWLLTECDRIEMYAGQATRDELLEILGPDWELVAEWPANANLLLRNRRA